MLSILNPGILWKFYTHLAYSTIHQYQVIVFENEEWQNLHQPEFEMGVKNGEVHFLVSRSNAQWT